MIELRVARSPAPPGQVERGLASLDSAPGCYFGVDAGVPGLHPLQASLLTAPALALHLFADGLQVQVLNAFGEALLAQPALARWRAAAAVRAPGASPIPALRAFLACFAPSPDVLLLGALPFSAHLLAQPGASTDALGVLFFGERLLRRDGAQQWHQVRLHIAGLAGAAQVAAQERGGERKHRLNPVSEEAPASLREPADDYAPGGYAGMVQRALPWLCERPLASLTLSQSYRRKVAISAAEAFARLRAVNPAPACFFLNDGAGEQLFGASPDLQLLVRDGEVQAMPVCGTVLRRPGAVGEAESMRELINEDVDSASLAVCTDALRDDLAPLCEPGSLRLLDRRRPMSMATVVHAVDRLAGRLRPGADAWDAIVATAAPVMVTGTPRAEALRAIRALEASPRGWYGGMVVQVAADGSALAGTILRAATVQGGIAEVRTGGDLMADSSPEREERESRLKTLSLWRAFALAQAPAGPQAASPVSCVEAACPGAVRLHPAGGLFRNSLLDCLLGLGLRITQDADTTVMAGTLADAELRCEATVAVGDAALQLLGAAGWAVRPVQPEHGRVVRCIPAGAAPWPDQGAFMAARYATLQLDAGRRPPGWDIWLADGEGVPMALAHASRRLVCLLFRPDSLMSEPPTLQVLRSALAFAAAGSRLAQDGAVAAAAVRFGASV